MLNARILIVEDESIVAEDIQASLVSMGYTVSALATSAEEAISVAKKDRPDLVLMDIILRGEAKGFETACKLRLHMDIPVIFLSGISGYNQTVPSGLHDFPEFIEKPVDMKELHGAIKMMIYKHQMGSRFIERRKTFRRRIKHREVS